jgi:hypothetical protein
MRASRAVSPGGAAILGCADCSNTSPAPGSPRGVRADIYATGVAKSRCRCGGSAAEPSTIRPAATQTIAACWGRCGTSSSPPSQERSSSKPSSYWFRCRCRCACVSAYPHPVSLAEATAQCPALILPHQRSRVRERRPETPGVFSRCSQYTRIAGVAPINVPLRARLRLNLRFRIPSLQACRRGKHPSPGSRALAGRRFPNGARPPGR